MVHLVTGSINSGKTTYMQSLYHSIGRGDGFIMTKVMKGHLVSKYEAIRLSTRESKVIVIRDEFKPDTFDVSCQIGPYLFCKEAISWVERSFSHMINEGIFPLFLDEVGQLELDGAGFHHVLVLLSQHQVECYISCRTDLAQPLIDKYHFLHTEIQSIPKK